MAYDYIRRTYGVDPVVGQSITFDGKPAVILRAKGDPQYLHVRLTGRRHAVDVHPTWKIDYSPALNVVVVSGPQGSGKSTHAQALRAFFGKRCVVDGWMPGDPAPSDSLLLTIAAVPGAIPIEQALRDAGISQPD